MSKEKDEDKSILQYFDMKEAGSEYHEAFGLKDVSLASAKYLSKAFFNAALYAGKEGVKAIKNGTLVDNVVKKCEIELRENKNMNPEMRTKMENFVQKNKKQA